MLTCLFNSFGHRIGNYIASSFTFLILANWNFNYSYLYLRLGSHVSSVPVYLFSSPERRSTNYTTFTFACLIPQELKLQSSVAAWGSLKSVLHHLFLCDGGWCDGGWGILIGQAVTRRQRIEGRSAMFEERSIKVAVADEQDGATLRQDLDLHCNKGKKSKYRPYRQCYLPLTYFKSYRYDTYRL